MQNMSIKILPTVHFFIQERAIEICYVVLFVSLISRSDYLSEIIASCKQVRIDILLSHYVFAFQCQYRPNRVLLSDANSMKLEVLN